jgi:hypothetical protein
MSLINKAIKKNKEQEFTFSKVDQFMFFNQNYIFLKNIKESYEARLSDLDPELFLQETKNFKGSINFLEIIRFLVNTLGSFESINKTKHKH